MFQEVFLIISVNGLMGAKIYKKIRTNSTKQRHMEVFDFTSNLKFK